MEPLGTPHDEWLMLLNDSATAPKGMVKLVEIGVPALPSLEMLLQSSKDAIAKGWAIQSIAKIQDPKASGLLQKIESDSEQDSLVRTWASAALIQRCTSIDELLELVALVEIYPALSRPIGLKLDDLSGGLNSLQALELVLKIPKLQKSLQPKILEGEPSLLIAAMLTHADMNIRRQSASYLATMGRSNKTTIPALLKAYDFTPSAREILWKGGPLYVPSIIWDKENGTALFAHLVSWYLFCDNKGLQAEKQQLYNNMRSVTLLGAIGMGRYIQNDTASILKSFGKVVGRRQLQIMLEEQGMKEKYAHVLGGE
jgi:HEAT repeat protein